MITIEERMVEYNTGSTSFEIPFEIDLASEIHVVHILESTRARTVLVKDIDYTVNVELDEITLITPGNWGTGTFILMGNDQFLQQVNLTEGGSFLAESVEDSLDRAIKLIQQLRDRVPIMDLSTGMLNKGVVAVPQADLIDNMMLPLKAERLGKFLRFDETSGLPEMSELLISGTVLSRSVIGGYLYPTTLSETNAGVTPKDFAYEPHHILRYIATDKHAAILAGTSTYDASTEVQDWIDSMEPGCEATLIGVVRAQGLTLVMDDFTLKGGGWIKPVSNAAPVTVLKIGNELTNVRRLRGMLKIGDPNGIYTNWDNVTGLDIAGLVEANLFLDVRAMGIGVLMSGENSTAQNNFYLGMMYNNKIGLLIDPTGPGYANECKYFGGRFEVQSNGYSPSVGGEEVVIGVKVTNGTGNIPNNHIFFGPTFQGPGQAINCDAVDIQFLNCRGEQSPTSGTPDVDFATDWISLGVNQNGTVITFGNNVTPFSGGRQIDHGAATRVNNFTFTIAADVTEYFYEGAVAQITNAEGTFLVPIRSSSYSAPDTTIRTMLPLITSDLTACLTPRIKAVGSSNPILIQFSNCDLPGTTDFVTATQSRYGKHFMKSCFTIEGVNDEYIALTLKAGNSGSDHVLNIADFDGVNAWLNGTGHMFAKRFSMGDVTTPVASQTLVADASTAHTLNATFSNTEVQNALNALGGKINSIFTILKAVGLMKSS